MNIFKLTALLLYFTISTVCAQVTITTGPDWKDAMIVKSLLASEAYMATTSYGTYPRINATAWTHSGYQKQLPPHLFARLSCKEKKLSFM